MDNVAGPMLRQMKQLGLSSKFMGGDGICTTSLPKLAGDALGNDMIYCAEAGGVEGKYVAKYAAFRERFKKDIGAEVVHSGVLDVHATGHAQADEIKTYLSIVNPDWYVPIHGEFRHMVANAKLGELMGVPHDRVVLCEDGDVLELTADDLRPVGRVPAGYLYVDGIVGDVGQGVIRDRQKLAEEGVVVVVVTVDVQTGKVLVGPEIITRGWVYAPEAEDLLDEACDTVADAVEAALAKGVRDVEALERDVRRAAGKFVSERTKRRPMIVPVVMEA